MPYPWLRGFAPEGLLWSMHSQSTTSHELCEAITVLFLGKVCTTIAMAKSATSARGKTRTLGGYTTSSNGSTKAGSCI